MGSAKHDPRSYRGEADRPKRPPQGPRVTDDLIAETMVVAFLAMMPPPPPWLDEDEEEVDARLMVHALLLAGEARRHHPLDVMLLAIARALGWRPDA